MAGPSQDSAGWRWAGASRQGTSHSKTGLPCQDAQRAVLAGAARDILVAVASDGAGSARFGGQGAAIVCRTFSERARAFADRTGALPDEEQVLEWLDEIRDRLALAAGRRDAALRDFAATLVAVIVSSDGAVIAHVGDGAVVVQEDHGWEIGSWPASGEYASTTFFVTDEGGVQLRYARRRTPAALAIFTDGMERLVLNFADQTAHGPFFDSMVAPVRKAVAPGRNATLSAALGKYLDSDGVNARTDDDKTLILAVAP